MTKREHIDTEHLQIVQRDVETLIPYARNARIHTDAQVAQIAASIHEFGFCNPVLIHGNQIVAGHGRLLAARKLGLAQVPTLDLSHLTKTQVRAYVLADNQLALNAAWDAEMLSVELAELKDDGFDLDLLGFDDLDTLLAEAGDEEAKAEIAKTLAERFGVPPFSILNAREGWWQGRKRAWLALGIQSEVGRGGTAGTPPHPPTVTQNPDGTLNYGGTKGQDKRFDGQRQGAAPGQRVITPRNSAGTGKAGR